MTTKQTIGAIWLTLVLAIGTAATAFPAIAKKTSNQRDSAQWLARAEAFQTADIKGVTVSSFAARLSEQHLPGQFDNPFMRDNAVIDDFLAVPVTVIERSQSVAQDYRCLSEAVYYEARSETRSGQKAVAEVVLNRVKNKHFPNTICGVVYQGSHRSTGCQFSFTCDGSMDRAPKGKAWKQSQAIAALMLTHTVKPLTNRATHYHTTQVNPHWSKSLKMTDRVGVHVFYRFAPRKRSTPSVSMAVAPPS